MKVTVPEIDKPKTGCILKMTLHLTGMGLTPTSLLLLLAGAEAGHPGAV